jgi:hypothetical protein
MFPMMCEAGGLGYPALIEHLVALALDEARTKAGFSCLKD